MIDRKLKFLFTEPVMKNYNYLANGSKIKTEVISQAHDKTVRGSSSNTAHHLVTEVSHPLYSCRYLQKSYDGFATYAK